MSSLRLEHLGRILWCVVFLMSYTYRSDAQSLAGDNLPCDQISSDNTWNIQSIGATNLCGTESRSIYVASGNTYQETLTYQWYSSSNNVNYAAVSNSNNDTLFNQSITATRWYKCTVYCDGNDSLMLGPLNYIVNTPVTPSVTIVITSGNNPTCTGNEITFSASATNGGTSPAYQWKVGNTNVGNNSPTFTTSSLTNGQVVSCVLTSNAPCTTAATATSNSIAITVNATVVPQVSIALTTGTNPTCSGNTLTFTATASGQGSSPAFQWKIGNTNVGNNSPTFTTSSLTNGQVVTCVLTSNDVCASPASVTSNAITMTVQPVLVPTISISQSPASGSVCEGEIMTYSIASQSNQGTAPVYSWTVNGVNVGSGSSYTGVIPVGDVNAIRCQLTSNAACASPSQVFSNIINLDVNPSVVPAVAISITSGTNPSCEGQSIAFTATPTNGGPGATFQWIVNSSPAGTGPTFSSSSFTNGAQVTCVMTSNAICRTANTATSSPITVLITNNVQPAVSISLTGGTNPSCAGVPMTFTAIPANGGTPSYQWKRNGNNVGTNSPTFSASNLNDNDQITVVMTSSIACASPTSATSLPFVVDIVSSLTPSVDIEFNAPEPFCPGTSVTFTAVPTHGGTLPVYSWTLDGVPQAGNSATLTATINTAGSHTVQVAMVSNAGCLSTPNANSGSVAFSVQNSVTPTISISSSDSDNSVCDFNSVSFEVSSLSGQGNNPGFQWRINNVLQPINADNITVDASLYPAGFIIYCTLNSSLACASPTSINSTTITTNVIPSAPAGVTVSVSDASVCDGTQVNFSANAQQGGTSPSFQWRVNNINVASGSTYSTSALNDGDVVTCEVTSNAACASPATVVSSAITMDIFPLPQVLLSVSSIPPICETDNVVLQSIFTQGEFPMNGIISEVSAANLNDIVVSGANSTVFLSTIPIANFGSYVFDYTALTDNNGCQFENADPVTVQVSQRPTVTVVPESFVYCEEESLSAVPLASSPSNAQSQYNWVVSGFGSYSSSSGFSSLNAVPGGTQADVVNGSAQSQSSVCVTANFNGCTSLAEDCFNVTVNAKPYIAELPDMAFCGGEQVGPILFTANPPLSGVQFDWELVGSPSTDIGFGVSGGNSLSGVMIETVSALQRSVSVYSELGQCADTMAFLVQVVPTPHVTSDLEQTFCSDDGLISIPLSNNGTTNETLWQLSPEQANLIGLISVNGSDLINLQNSSGLTAPVQNTILLTAKDTQLGKTCFGETELLEVRILHNPDAQSLIQSTICDGEGYSSMVAVSGETSFFQWDAAGANESLIFNPVSNIISGNQFVINAITNLTENLQSATIDYWAGFTQFGHTCYGDTLELSLDVFPSPSINFEGQNSVLCSSSPFNSEISSSTSPSTFWSWEVQSDSGILGGTDCSADCQNISDSFQNPTVEVGQVQYVFNTGIEGSECLSSDTLNIFINPIPDNLISLSSPEIICAGSDNILITTTSVPANDLSWTIEPPEAGELIAGGENGSIVYLTLNPDASGNITLHITVTDQNNCQSEAAETLSINSDSVIPDFFIASVNEGSQLMTLVSLPFNSNATYQWGYIDLQEGWNETILTGEVFQDYIVGNSFDPDKLYWVEITLNGCVTKVFFQSLVQLNEETLNRDIIAYPNPVSDLLNIKSLGTAEMNSVELLDYAGRLVSRYTVINGQSALVIETGAFANGVYLLRVNTNQSNCYFRIIKN